MSDKVIQVLLVEDDPLVKWTCRRTLESMQYSVTEASGCAEGEDLWLSSCFDLVISDYRLEDGLGVDMIGRMRAKGHAQPVICLTAEASRISNATVAELRISDVLGKPVSVETLKAAVSRALAKGVHQNTSDSVQETRVGRFSVVKIPARLTAEFLKNISTEKLGNTWIALDLRGTAALEDASLETLLLLSAGLTQCGGRLCLVGAGGEVKKNLASGGLDREMDLFENIDELGPAGRRLTADCERSALFDSVVREP